MKKNHLYLSGAVLLLLFGGYSFVAFQDSLTPYVSYAEAIVAERTVQVAGALAKGSSAYDIEAEALRFTLVDTEESGDTLRVRYSGIKPANFEDAISIVAIGRYEDGSGEFVADELLVKCPSKYQGIEKKGEDAYETKSYG
jgi:cytochrome c-type biogenesis protein CcmE